MSTVIWVLFYLAFPAAVLWACRRSSLLEAVGGIVLCYAAGIIIGNIGILPDQAPVIQDMLTMIVIPLALPLIFFSMNIRGWGKQSGMLVKAFIGAFVSVIAGSLLVFLLMGGMIGGESWKVSGMLIGCYTGGTPNLAAIGTALDVSSTQYLAVHASDVIVGALLLLIVLTVFPGMLKRLLPPYVSAGSKTGADTEDRNTKIDDAETDEPKIEAETGTETGTETAADRHDSFAKDFSGFRREHLKPLFFAFLLSVGIFAVGGGISLVVPEGVSTLTAILIITTLGISASFITKIRSIPYTFQLGYYLLLVFSLTVSSMADIRELAGTAPDMIVYVAVLLAVVSIIHIIISRILKVDRDTHIITAVALIYSPPFVPLAAAVLKNKEVIISGIIAGIAGWVIGNYIGIGFGYLLKGVLV